MKLINEIANDWDIASIIKEMDAVLQQYDGIVATLSLNEGALDAISDDVINAVTEIQNRINVIKKAKGAISDWDTMSPDDKESNKYKLARNKKLVMLSLDRVKKRMAEFNELAKEELGVTGLEKLPNKPQANSPESSDLEPMDIEQFGRQAPFLLNRASKNELDVDSDSFDKYLDTFDALVGAGLMTNNGTLTPLGKVSFEARAAKKKPSGSAINDLMNM